MAQHVFGSRREINGAVRYVAIDRPPFVRASIALVVHAVHSSVIYPRFMQESGGLAIGGRVTEDIAALDTFPKLLMHHARVRPERPAIREKDLGIWQTWTWREFADEVRDLAAALAP